MKNLLVALGILTVLLFLKVSVMSVDEYLRLQARQTVAFEQLVYDIQSQRKRI